MTVERAIEQMVRLIERRWQMQADATRLEMMSAGFAPAEVDAAIAIGREQFEEARGSLAASLRAMVADAYPAGGIGRVTMTP